jgi:hypothetical protein
MPSIIKVDQIQSDTGTVNLASNIAFASASVLGNVNFDSGTMFVDATNNRVGVGTATPTSPLDVNGLIRTTGFVTNPASGAGMEMAWDGTKGVIQAFSNRATLTTAPISFSGGQIQFPASQNASADANTLDDYEEGTWTPTAWGGGNITTATGTYVKIGGMVYVSAYVSYGTTANGDAAGFQNLPFTVFNSDGARGCSTVGYSNFGSVFWAMVASNSTRVIFYNVSGVTYVNSDFSNKDVYFGAVYRVA